MCEEEETNLIALTRETVIESSARLVNYDEIRKYRNDKQLFECSSSYFCKETGAVEMARLFAVEDGAHTVYSTVNKVAIEDGEAMEMRVALPANNAVKEKFMNNFNQNKGGQREIVKIFISTKVTCGDTLQGDGWINKEWGMGSVYKIDTANTLPRWFQVKRDIFMIEKILAHRRRDENLEYLIRWAGYNEDWDTWEPEANILDDKDDNAISRYMAGPTVHIMDSSTSVSESDASYTETSCSSSCDEETISFEKRVSQNQSKACDLSMRELRLQIAKTKKAWSQARQCMQKSLQIATDELNAASKIFSQLTDQQNIVSCAQSRKRVRCDATVCVRNLRKMLDENFGDTNQ